MPHRSQTWLQNRQLLPRARSAAAPATRPCRCCSAAVLGRALADLLLRHHTLPRFRQLWGKYSSKSGRVELLTPGQEVCVPQGQDESGLFAVSGE